MLISSAFAAAVGLTLVPFGAIDGKLERSPWFGFHDGDSPLLVVTRVERGKLPAGKACAPLLKQVAAYRPAGDKFDSEKPAFAAWGPWTEEDLDAAKDCDSFPCPVKLTESEVKIMTAAPEAARRVKWEELVALRVRAYSQTQKRGEYEFPGDPVDPWAKFAALGYPIPASISSAPPALYARSLAFAPGRLRPLRQVIDVRHSVADGVAVVAIRDAYTAHYFDGWGEWIYFACDAKAGTATLGHALMLEFDLLKKGDIFSRISRGKMKSTVDERGRAYLDSARTEILQTKLE